MRINLAISIFIEWNEWEDDIILVCYLLCQVFLIMTLISKIILLRIPHHFIKLRLLSNLATLTMINFHYSGVSSNRACAMAHNALKLITVTGTKVAQFSLEINSNAFL